MAVQHIFISKSAPIRNRTLFSIVAVDNHQRAQIIKVREHLLSESTVLYWEKLLSTSADTIGAYLIRLR